MGSVFTSSSTALEDDSSPVEKTILFVKEVGLFHQTGYLVGFVLHMFYWLIAFLLILFNY